MTIGKLDAPGFGISFGITVRAPGLNFMVVRT
jgi:hypothetical protein